jgi:hypothetical protein
MLRFKMTLGQDRVRAQFNPGGDPLVVEIKRKTAELIDLCDQHHVDDIGAETKRLWSLAMTHYEDAAMWAVKAATVSK